MRIRLPTQLHKKVQELAGQNGESMASLVRRHVQQIPYNTKDRHPEWIDTSIRLSPDEVERLDGLAAALFTSRTGALQFVLDRVTREGEAPDENFNDAIGR